MGGVKVLSETLNLGSAGIIITSSLGEITSISLNSDVVSLILPLPLAKDVFSSY